MYILEYSNMCVCMHIIYTYILIHLQKYNTPTHVCFLLAKEQHVVPENGGVVVPALPKTTLFSVNERNFKWKGPQNAL